MDELCSTAKQCIEILKRCNSPEVKNWGKEDLTRALQWCKYFNEVYVHIAKKRSVIQSFNEKLTTIGYSMGFRCGGTALSAQFLSNSSEYLVKALLENPALPQALREVVLDLAGERLNLEQHCTQDAKDRVVLSTLQTIHSRLLPYCPEGGYKENLVLTDARCVREDLQWCLQSSNPKNMFHRRLESLALQEGGMKTILHSFLIQPEDQVGAAIISWVLQLLHSWKPPLDVAAAAKWKDNANSFWKDTPPLVLADVSSHSEEFCDLYLIFLSHWAKHIGKQSPSHCGEQSPSHSGNEERNALIKHFHTLAKSSPKLTDLCIQVIVSHFDLSSALQRGPQCVDVWGQLMAAVTAEPPDPEVLPSQLD